MSKEQKQLLLQIAELIVEDFELDMKDCWTSDDHSKSIRIFQEKKELKKQYAEKYGELCATYEKASPPSLRIKAIEKLQEQGFDVSVRLSPFIPQFVDIDKINAIKCDKILIEFLKVNGWVKKWFSIDYSEYTLKFGGYNHLPLERKKELVKLITGYKQVSVGEYVKEHYEYFRDNVNYNPKDCCNLRSVE